MLLNTTSSSVGVVLGALPVLLIGVPVVNFITFVPFIRLIVGAVMFGVFPVVSPSALLCL